MVPHCTLHRALTVPQWDRSAHTPCCTRTSTLQRMGARGGRRSSGWTERREMAGLGGVAATMSAAEKETAADDPHLLLERGGGRWRA
jgi:hypothetical protein